MPRKTTEGFAIPGRDMGSVAGIGRDRPGRRGALKQKNKSDQSNIAD